MKKSLLPLFCFLLAMQLMGCSAGKVAVVERPMVIAHRGGASLGPENSLMAIERAIALGVDAVEVDVRLSADGHVVVMHDKSVNRTTDGKGCVNGLSLAQLKKFSLLDAVGNKTGERIPALDEVLGLVAGRCRVLIEIKDNDSRGIEPAVVDVVAILTDSATPRNYWKVLKNRLKKEGNESVTNCNQLKLLSSDGKRYLTDVADQEQLFRIIQSIPSPKAEPFKQWMAMVAAQRLDQMQDPELSIEQAILDYKRLGYFDAWINQRIKSIEVRKELTDEWQRTGVNVGMEYASLTDIITKEWSGMTTKQYKHLKGLKKENLRDNMTNLEIALNTLAEASATELSKQRNPKGFRQQTHVAKDGGSVAKVARKQLEKQLGRTIISSEKASDYILPIESKKE